MLALAWFAAPAATRAAWELCLPLVPLCLQVAGLPMLAPFAQRMEQLIEQLAACLEALAAMVRKQASPDE